MIDKNELRELMVEHLRIRLDKIYSMATRRDYLVATLHWFDDDGKELEDAVVTDIDSDSIALEK